MAGVLVVSGRASVIALAIQALEAEGHDVMVCPGPGWPDYACIAERGGTCALVAGADVVVVDCDLESDEMDEGMSVWHLFAYYRDHGLPIVAVADPAAAGELAALEADEIVPTTASPRVLRNAVTRAHARSAAGRR